MINTRVQLREIEKKLKLKLNEDQSLTEIRTKKKPQQKPIVIGYILYVIARMCT